jgi:hypothetical protein
LFKPEQFKSAGSSFDISDKRQTFNIGGVAAKVLTKAFSPKGDSGFFSYAEKAAQAMSRTKGTGDEFISELTSKKINVQQDELEWTGFLSEFKGKPKTTKDEVVSFLAANRLDVEEAVGRDIPGKLDFGTVANEATMLKGMDADFATKPIHKEYTWDGQATENYREVVLKLPKNKQSGLEPYRHPEHFPEDQENILAHVRFSDIVSADGKKMLVQKGSSWQVVNTSGASGKGGKNFSINIKMKLNRLEEWNQMFEEAWRYERDYFYDPEMHGRDWDVVHDRYAPLVPFIRHRTDLNYVLDQVNGELSVGHSFVFGGDFPSTDRSNVGLLGADLVIDNDRWQIKRIYTTESWNPGLTSPLDRPGMNVKEGYYLVGVNGKELNAATDPFQFLDGTMGIQTVLHINDKPSFEGAWKETAEPIRSENALRQRAWVEDNRRMVDKLSNGRLGYVWVPNTGGSGFVSFNRYFFAQQDKEGAVIDERFNGGGSLDDYMVDLMTRSLRAGLTNEVPNGKPLKLPAGILGPKVLLINELAGSGGDFFPWAFRQQKAGPIIGARTWGGLVKSSVHYSLIDGGALTAPDNAVFDPINNCICCTIDIHVAVVDESIRANLN